eukprot:12411862-Karenia_brevis.AAC.1
MFLPELPQSRACADPVRQCANESGITAMRATLQSGDTQLADHRIDQPGTMEMLLRPLPASDRRL